MMHRGNSCEPCLTGAYTNFTEGNTKCQLCPAGMHGWAWCHEYKEVYDAANNPFVRDILNGKSYSDMDEHRFVSPRTASPAGSSCKDR